MRFTWLVRAQGTAASASVGLLSSADTILEYRKYAHTRTTLNIRTSPNVSLVVQGCETKQYNNEVILRFRRIASARTSYLPLFLAMLDPCPPFI
jgi:hypothetical protein